MINLSKLKEKIEKKGLKKKVVARELDLTPYGLSKKLEGTTEFKVSEVVKLSNLLDLTDDEKNAIFFTIKGD